MKLNRLIGPHGSASKTLDNRHRPLPIFVATVAICVTVLIGCSDSDSKNNTKNSESNSTPSSEEVSTQTEEIAGLADVQECKNQDGTGTASGTIMNAGDKTAAFQIVIGYTDTNTQEVISTSTVRVESVPPGEELPWEVTSDAVGSAEIECHAQYVNGTAE